MTFWAYMLHCKGGYFYTGHTDDLEHRMAQHASGRVPGFVLDHWPAKLVWSADFATRYEALAAERQIKGWSRAKKLALIREDWDAISQLARNREQEKQGFDNGQVRMFPGHPQPCPRGQGDLTISPNGIRVVRALHPHPLSSSAAVTGFDVGLARPSSRLLALRYTVTGAIPDIDLPSTAAPERTDELWKQSCFEAFIASASGYYELNFSPSTQWAAYRFDGYRSGMRHAKIAPPRIETSSSAGRFELRAEVEFPKGAGGKLGLAAVIKDKTGTKSYWALAHPSGDPDFHHPDCFILDLPPAPVP